MDKTCRTIRHSKTQYPHTVTLEKCTDLTCIKSNHTICPWSICYKVLHYSIDPYTELKITKCMSPWCFNEKHIKCPYCYGELHADI